MEFNPEVENLVYFSSLKSAKIGHFLDFVRVFCYEAFI